MTNIELTQITQLLHNNPDKFYTDLAAHKKGYTTEHRQLFSMYNLSKPHIIEYISSQTPHLLQHYVRNEGKLKEKIGNIDIFYNYHLYDEDVIYRDITKERLHLYVKIINELSDRLKTRIYELLDKTHFTLILNHDLIIPTHYLKEEYLIMYINYVSSMPNFEAFLLDLNKPVFIFDNYQYISNEIVDKYIMKNVTIVNENVLKSLLYTGLTIKSILKYNNKFLTCIIPYINTLDEFKILLDSIQKDTSMEDIGKIIGKFPYMRSIIERAIEQKIKG